MRPVTTLALVALLLLYGPAMAQTVTPIADIQANPNAFVSQTVTVEGQIYVPANYRGSIFSGYIQDGSGRGINLFGSEANNALLFDTGHVVRVTGTVSIFFTTVEIVSISEVLLLSSGNPPLNPTILSTGGAANSAWEGTFIQCTGPITSAVQAGPGRNYTINDGSGPVVVRVVDALGAPELLVGQTITARGAGGHFQADFQIHVGSPSDVFPGGMDTVPPVLVSASAPTPTLVVVAFNEAVTVASSEDASNYELFETVMPANTTLISSATLRAGSHEVELAPGSALVEDTSYTVRVSDVEDEAGNVIAPNSTVSFTFSTSQVTPIADIHADLVTFLGQAVTIQAQVYIPTNYRSTVFSGYVQDNSGRGINVFGSGANSSFLFDTTNVVRLTGSVETFFTTVEIVDITEVTLISGGNPPVAPTVLGTGAAASPTWEGTFIQTSGTIVTTTRGGPGWNYTVNDGSGPITIRVIDDLGVSELSVGTTITGRGAGSQFQDEFQVLIGHVDDVFPMLVNVEGSTWSRVKQSYREE